LYDSLLLFGRGHAARVSSQPTDQRCLSIIAPVRLPAPNGKKTARVG